MFEFVAWIDFENESHYINLSHVGSVLSDIIL